MCPKGLLRLYGSKVKLLLIAFRETPLLIRWAAGILELFKRDSREQCNGKLRLPTRYSYEMCSNAYGIAESQLRSQESCLPVSEVYFFSLCPSHRMPRVTRPRGLLVSGPVLRLATCSSLLIAGVHSG